MSFSRATKRAVVLLTLPALLAVSTALLVIEMTRSDDEPPAQGALISQASSQAASGTSPSAVALVPSARGSTTGAEPEPAAADGQKKKKQKKKRAKPAPPPLPDVEGTISIAAVGDIVMGTPTFGFPPEGGKTFFDGVADLLSGDIVLGNLEGTLSVGGAPRCSEDEENCFSFQTPPEYARWLKRAGFTTLNLANNHAYDFGAAGLAQTRAALKARELRHTGAPGQITLHRRGKIRVAVVGFSTFRWAADMRDIPAAIELVEEATRRAHIVIVTMHAGAEGAQHQHVAPGVERFLGQNRGDVVRFARAAVNAGADLVVGHGPHVLRGMEWHRGRLIAYSLGNFGAYNAFNLATPRQYGGILKATLNADGSWARGKLVATRLEGKGLPVRDRAEHAHRLVRKLSRADFPKKAVRIDPRGVLLQEKE